MKHLVAGVVMILSVAFLLNVNAQDAKYTTKDVMQKAMKGGLMKKVASGGATEAEKKQLVDLFASLHANKPPKGSQDNWNKITEALLAAAKSGDGKAMMATANCGSCHKEFKGK
jgi:surface antigen